MSNKNLDTSQWREKLSDEEYRVLREKGTERAFTGEYYDTKTEGTYHCKGCGAGLFASESKFDSGSGWPSFTDPASEDSVAEILDDTHGMRRVEVVCNTCESHLGHVFPDGPSESGNRYCINSISLDLQEE